MRTLLISKEMRELPDLVHSWSVTVDELARAQRLTEQRMQELAAAQERLGKAGSSLPTAFRATVEEEVASVVKSDGNGLNRRMVWRNDKHSLSEMS